MTSDPKPCPAHGHRSCCRVEVDEVPYKSQSDWPGESGTLFDWQVSADCGVSGPIGGTREEAVEAWNAMPRHPVLRPFADWHEDHGCGLWWKQPIAEPPFAGCPLDSDWPWGEIEEPDLVWIACPEPASDRLEVTGG